ncbi:single-stranded-DNA-specific exonuclease RecJ [Clostridium thermosuccinogenes]|uniref:single-stranded-DNA-specific exonuclease RecJ n=1 Tax=Clostridium thermosuccinogenes TaxID=84032 RepID=UPI000CCC92E3|nr:single-stranded-DNA-specific exonuclease RecJ [Pseudoclostridium thermosuccinogenes]PNT92686.1 single-stranded-DNA-specific exonuclease RecJ [Pseudoclostridium thermosuccinogenes]
MKIDVNILNENIHIPDEIIEAADGDKLIARIFFNRGYKDPDTIRQMLCEDLYTPVQPEEFPRMDKAVARIAKAIETREKIAVYGDYDVDGVTSTALLVQCLTWYSSSVIYHVPDRFTEGYGMNEDVIRSMAKDGVSLIITCDCGISNINEIKTAKDLGMDVVITDHHNLPDVLPEADVILNPKLLGEGHKARNLSGCGMAYFLALALLEHYGESEKAEAFLDLLAMSLIADVVSLNGENRYLLKKALPKLFGSKRTGLKALLEIAEKDSKLQSEEDVAFQLAPRLNAAGRMESARLPVELLLCSDAQKAMEMALKIDHLNRERKRIQQEMVDEAIEQVENRKKNKSILVLFSEFWHHGIIGIAAGKVCETYRKPAILFSLKEDGTTVTGSARSTEEVNIYELIKACSSKLLKFGGHSQAAGLSLKREDLEEFTREIEELAEREYFIKDEIKVNADMELTLDNIDEELYGRILKAGPYGEGFEAPCFITRGATVASDRKTAKRHHIMVLADGHGNRLPAVKWFGEDEDLSGKLFDIVYKIGRNTYRGNDEIQLTISHLLPVEGTPEAVFEGEFIDGRGMDIKTLLKDFEEAVFFYEGLRLKCPVDNIVDRYDLRTSKKVETLVFLSTPVNASVFREVIALARPRKVVLSFAVTQDYTFKGFMTNLMGLVKHIINKQGGRSSLEQLALMLCVEDNIMRAALKYLRTIAPVEFLENSEDEIYIYGVKERSTANNIAVEKNIKNALMEKNAYQQFLMKLDVKSFGQYLK